jgi:hypothetical protein
LVVINEVYDSLPERSTILTFTGTLPVGHRDLDRQRLVRISPWVRDADGDLDAVVAEIRRTAPDVVIHTPAQELFGVQQQDLPAGWSEPILAALTTRLGGEVTYQSDDITVVRFTDPVVTTDRTQEDQP